MMTLFALYLLGFGAPDRWSPLGSGGNGCDVTNKYKMKVF
jgi:hypothetical protein